MSLVLAPKRKLQSYSILSYPILSYFIQSTWLGGSCLVAGVAALLILLSSAARPALGKPLLNPSPILFGGRRRDGYCPLGIAPTLIVSGTDCWGPCVGPCLQSCTVCEHDRNASQHSPAAPPLALQVRAALGTVGACWRPPTGLPPPPLSRLLLIQHLHTHHRRGLASHLTRPHTRTLHVFIAGCQAQLKCRHA
jgi:hypothetical protein